jgi:hypothetical protein
VPVVMAVTAWTNAETGETFILYFPQMLWYGKKMKASLINPNQLRHYGLKVCDDVTDKERLFGIQLDEDLLIPFKMDGTVIYFDTRAPSKLEMDNFRIYAMTDDTSWDPSNVKIGKIKQISREAMCMMEIQNIACTSQMTQYDLERSIVQSVSGAYDGPTMMRRMVKAVNIATESQKYKRDGTYVNKYLNIITYGVSFIGSKDQHKHVTAEEVAQKFRCGMETAKQTLLTTTQHGIQQARHPLHRQNRVDHIHLNCRRLNDTFYTDMLFSRVKLIGGCKCA